MAELDDLDCEEPYSDGDSEAEVEEFLLPASNFIIKNNVLAFCQR